MLSFAQIASLATRIILSVFLINETPRLKSELVNVAIGKSTSQSGERWPSRNAVDGQKGCMTVDKQHFALTDDSHLPWWEVNLGDQFRIQEIIVHGRHGGRTSQLHGFRLYLSSSNVFTEKNIVYTNTDYNGGTISITLNLTGLFQFVKLDLPDTYRSPLNDYSNDKQPGPLVLCEVEVFVNKLDCQTGTYRDYKEYQCKNCGHCKRKPCIKENGSCPEGGCMAGWTGTKCNITCRDGHYGENCLENCTANCLGGNSQCSKADGKCQQGCVKGYQGDKCESQCPSSKYSYNCNETCTTCTQTNCTNEDGGCLNGCIPGHKPTDLYCREVCDDGFYGQNCLHHCSGRCKGGDHQCNKTNGKCMQGCVAGYTGERCEAKCPPGFYGPGCTEACHHCKNGTTCDYQSGNCSKGCNLGFEGKLCDKECQDGYFGDCSHRCHCMGDESCQKTDGVCTGTCAFGWSGNNCSLDLNLIRQLTHVVTNQTGVFKTYDSTKAIDGKDRYDVDNCNCCSVTNGNGSSWWQIDLREKYLIDTVKIYGRGDTGHNYQLENATVYASNQTMVNNNMSQTFIYRIPTITTSTVFTKNLNTATIAQFFIVKSVQHILIICEFKLFRKVCDVGKFGTGCNHTCHCSDEKSCDSITGKCKESGCFPGWRGDSCNLKCESKSFGKNCSQTCQCINGTNCDNVNGQCDEHECDPGWIGASCQTNENILSQLKNEIKTSMSTVVRNWTSDRAVDGDTGPDPDKCQCCSGTTNAHMSWWMVNFGQSIPIKGISIYGRNNEKDYRQLVGFQVVLSDRIVRNTSSVLYRRSGDFSSIYEMSLPNVITRFIKIQRPGVLTLCEVKVIQGVCKNGRFGRECEQECHCADKKQCDQITGYCQFPACKTGWQGLACNKTCPLDTFGDNCNDSCYCAEGTCTNNYGICPGECRQGYHGPHCNQVGSEMKSRTALILGAVGSAGALLIIGVIIGIVVLYIRRKRRPSRKNEYETPNLYVTPTETQEYDTIENINGSEYSNRIARGIETETEFQNK